MIDLISYWVLVTLCTLLLLSSVSPIIIVIGNHAASFISREKLSGTWFSHKVIKFCRMDKWLQPCLDWTRPNYDTPPADYRWNFELGFGTIIGIFSVLGWLLTWAVLSDTEITLDLVYAVHIVALTLAPHVSYVTVGLVVYVLMLFGARAVFGLQQKLKRLMSQGESND